MSHFLYICIIAELNLIIEIIENYLWDFFLETEKVIYPLSPEKVMKVGICY